MSTTHLWSRIVSARYVHLLILIASLFSTSFNFKVLAQESMLMTALEKPRFPNVYWAKRVVYVSSAAMPMGPNSSTQLLGEPNSLSFGDKPSPCAWTSLADTKLHGEAINYPEEILRVSFDTAITARQLAVVESLYPGAVESIILFGINGESKEIYNAKPRPRGIFGKTLTIVFPETEFLVAEVEIHLVTGVIPGINQIDAVGLSQSADTIQNTILTVPYANKLYLTALGEEINSPFQEIAPVISADGKTIYFSRLGHPDNKNGNDNTDIWYAELSSDKKNFLFAKNVGFPINDQFPNFACNISPDGTRMLLANEYIPNSVSKGGASLSIQTKNGWSYPQYLPILKYYNRHKQGHFCLSSDRKVLLMCIDREDSFGGSDIYISFAGNDSLWSAPIHLDGVLNSAGNESTLFLAPDTKTLFFSSNGHNGYGDNDIFVARRTDSTWLKWTKPLNMGPVVNSEKWDGYFSIDASGANAFTVSTTGSGTNQDIFRIFVPSQLRSDPVGLVEGKVLDLGNRNPIAAKIFFEDLKNGNQIGIAETNPHSGEFQIVLPSGKHYGYRAEVEGYLPISKNLDLTALKQFQYYYTDLMMIPIEAGKSFVVNNIFFDTGKSLLKSESFPELRRLADKMKEYPTIKLTIYGHTDNQGTETSNKQLSLSRAKSVMQYLAARGIPSQRLKIQGLGGTAPVADNDTEEGRSQNRRVEISFHQ